MPGYEAADDGTITHYYTNQQSARLMFYHDHVYGITRLNVYAGEAAAYLIRDGVEQSLIDAGRIPADEIPLVIQDKTFVDASTIGDLDPTWRWGTGVDGNSNGYPDYKTGDLWVPHVYMPAQNPVDPSGMAAMGRWHYGPWFWPPTVGIKYGPTTNPYYDPINWPWEPAEIPNVPDPSMGMESFNDTPLVNGTAYPTLTVEPKAYRFRILNAANDRFWNLQLYEADPSVTSPIPGVGLSEVKMVPAGKYSADPTWPQDYTEGNATWPVDGRDGGVPDWKLRGPDWIQIGNESGFLPMPAVIEQRPVDWNVDVTTFNAGIVNSGSLILGPAERADVVVDFSAFAGKTLILYNDAPAAFPAPDPRYDYYTGSPNLSDTGGYAGTPVGYGPNTRTVMQIKVSGGTSSSLVIPGWNLIAGGPGSQVQGATLYAYDGTQYTVADPANMVPGKGYWASYTASATVSIKTVPAPVTVGLVAGWNLIGNPTGNTVTLPSGVQAFVFENGSYQPVTSLLSGQGAWVNVATPQDVVLVSNGTGPASAFDVATLEGAWEKTDTQQGVFERAQDPIIVAQGEILPGRDQYNRAYNALFPATSPLWGISRIQDKSLSFKTIAGTTFSMPMKEKAIQDEMGETFDDRGRMAGNLGVMLPNPQPAGQTFVLQEYSDPATEIFTVTATPLSPPLAGDGTQIWKITHNGVDTHPIHFHLFDVQVINRVGWDNLITLPAANELGWKETLRVSPLEDTIVAMRPVIPELPFKVPDSVREYEPILGRDVTSDMFTSLDPTTGQALPTPQQNNLVSFGWEYMWHCHILSHEEMMMMRATAVYVAPAPASGLQVTGATGGVALQWVNNRSMVNPMYLSLGPLVLPAATNFIVQRATDADFTVGAQTFEVVKVPKAAYADQEVVAFTDMSAVVGTQYYYRARAENGQGYSSWSSSVTATPTAAP
jgi:FtsP/CotA-like multicopper oxidase with cupredoxin domain